MKSSIFLNCYRNIKHRELDFRGCNVNFLFPSTVINKYVTIVFISYSTVFNIICFMVQNISNIILLCILISTSVFSGQVKILNVIRFIDFFFSFVYLIAKPVYSSVSEKTRVSCFVCSNTQRYNHKLL